MIWGPVAGEVRQLSLLPGDTVGVAMWIDEKGEAIGESGTCADTLFPPSAFGKHAVMWDVAGTPHDLGNLGGTVDLTVPFMGQIALANNNKNEIVGASALTGNTTSHAFLWTHDTGIQDLGTLPGDVQSGGLDINDRTEAVGPSVDSMGNARVSLAPRRDDRYLILAFGINDHGDIVGLGPPAPATFTLIWRLPDVA